MTFNIVTVDELNKELNDYIAAHGEPAELLENLKVLASTLCDLSRKCNHIVILTDYDADGICSAYIMEKLLKALNPRKDFHVEVRCNDSRGSYGVSKDIVAEEDTKYIVLDMGSNDLDFIRNTLGEDTIIVDHHVIETSSVRSAFRHDRHLLNPKCRKCEDGSYTEYCATGLVYRLFQILLERKELIIDFPTRNSVTAAACIGTIADCVPVMDKHSLNYDIIMEGFNVVNNADEDTLPFPWGYFLRTAGFNEFDCTAQQFKFGVCPMLNVGYRLSPVLNENLSQMIYDTLSGADNITTYDRINYIQTLNTQRKAAVKVLTEDPQYKKFVYDERERNLDSNVCVYLIPDGQTPRSFCGPLANKLADALEKAVICLTYNEEQQCWQGSARNAPGQSSLLKFIYDILARPEGKDLNVKFGGHDNALGISSIPDKDAMQFVSLVHQYHDLLKGKPPLETVLAIDPLQLNSPEMLEKIRRLEPTGLLEKYPCLFKGKELYRNGKFDSKGGKDVKVKVDNDKNKIIESHDFCYTDNAYPWTKTKEEVAVLCTIGVCTYKEEKLQFNSVADRDFLKDRREEVQNEIAKATKKSKGKDA